MPKVDESLQAQKTQRKVTQEDVGKPKKKNVIFARMKYQDYKGFANCPQRNNENLISILQKIMPYYSEITKTKKKNILQNFEEVEYYTKGTILEREGCTAEYVYIILRGEISLYKKLP